MLDTSMRITPTKIFLDRVLSQTGVLDRVLSYATWATCWSNGAFGTRQRSTRDSASLHPCRQAAYFLPCARPPDACGFFLARPRLRLAQGSRDRAEARAFAVTRSGTDTMPRRGDDDDLEEDTVPAAPAGPGRRYGAAAGPGHRSSSLSPLFYCSFCDRTQFFQASRTSFLLVHPRRTPRRPP